MLQKWKECIWEEIEAAGQEEKSLAIQNKQVDENGMPWITVYLDGAWSKRSYGHTYDAHSGIVSNINMKIM